MNGTNLNYSHDYNPVGPLAYFITFRTYGTWLHGDYRYSTDRKKANSPGSPMITPNMELEKTEKSYMKHPAVKFDQKQRGVVDSTIHEVIAYKKWILHALNVREAHVHIVLTADKSPELVMNSMKSWCTRRLRENGLLSSQIEPWSRRSGYCIME